MRNLLLILTMFTLMVSCNKSHKVIPTYKCKVFAMCKNSKKDWIYIKLSYTNPYRTDSVALITSNGMQHTLIDFKYEASYDHIMSNPDTSNHILTAIFYHEYGNDLRRVQIMD